MSNSVVTEIKSDCKQQLDLLQWDKDGAVIFIRTFPENRLFSKLAAIIEDEGLQLLSIGSRQTDDGYTEVYAKISTHEALYAILALQRHGYNAWTDDEDAIAILEDKMRRSYDQLMSYIEN